MKTSCSTCVSTLRKSGEAHRALSPIIGAEVPSNSTRDSIIMSTVSTGRSLMDGISKTARNILRFLGRGKDECGNLQVQIQLRQRTPTKQTMISILTRSYSIMESNLDSRRYINT